MASVACDPFDELVPSDENIGLMVRVEMTDQLTRAAVDDESFLNVPEIVENAVANAIQALPPEKMDQLMSRFLKDIRSLVTERVQLIADEFVQGRLDS